MRRLAGAMRRASRYLATVRRAHSMPCSLSRSEIWLSDSGLLGLSAATSWRINARTAVLEVLGADLKNGLLSIDLFRPQPERIVKTISINEQE